MIKVILIFLLVLSVLVLVHELAHFLAALWHKVRVLEFGLGFPPRMVRLFRWRKTWFSLNWLPIGGFVSMAGESEDTAVEEKEQNTKKSKKDTTVVEDENIPRAELFYYKKAWQRAAIILAGPLANIFLGVVLFAIIFCIIGIPVKMSGGAGVAYIQPASPAEEAGLQAGDVIGQMRATGFQEGVSEEEVDRENSNWVHIEDADQAREWIGQHRGQWVEVEVVRADDKQILTAYIRTQEETPAGEGSLGVGFDEYVFEFYPWYQQIPLGVAKGLEQSWTMAVMIVDSLGQMLSQLITRQEQSTQLDVVGPVGMVNQIQKQGLFDEGFLSIVQFAAVLSVNLGVMNLLPVPALDGGKLLMIGAGKIFGRKRVAKVEGYLDGLGFLLLILLMLFVTAKDVFSIIGG